jgi:hypothetical protein
MRRIPRATWSVDDLTELRLLERQVCQKEQMAAIGAMSAGIAHEIRIRWHRSRF